MSTQTLTVQGIPAVRTHTSYTDKTLGTQPANTTRNYQVGGSAGNTGNVPQTLVVTVTSADCQVTNPVFSRVSDGSAVHGDTITLQPGDSAKLYIDVTTGSKNIGDPDTQVSVTVDEVWS